MKPLNSGQLFEIALSVRRFLEPVWPGWHRASGRPVPHPLSSKACGRSSLFLCDALRLEGLAAEWTNGSPFVGNNLCRHPFGFRMEDRWKAHAWVVCNDAIVDVTADQFGAEAVIVTNSKDPRYAANDIDTAYASAIDARHAAVAAIWGDWLSIRELKAE